MRGRKRKTITKTDEKSPVKESKTSDRQNEAKQDKIVPVFTPRNKRRKVCNYISTTESSYTEARTTKDTESKTYEKSESIKIGDSGISEKATLEEVKKLKESNQIQEEVSPDTQSDIKSQKNINETKLDNEPAIEDKNTREIETPDNTRRGSQEILGESLTEFAKSAVVILKKVSESPAEPDTKMEEMNIEVKNPEDVPVSSKRKPEINVLKETSDEELNSQEPEIIQLKEEMNIEVLHLEDVPVSSKRKPEINLLKETYDEELNSQEPKIIPLQETSHEELKSQEPEILMEHNLGTTLQDETSMVHETSEKAVDKMSEKVEAKSEILDIAGHGEKENKTLDGAEIPNIIEVDNMRKRPDGNSEETVIKSNSDSVNDLEHHTSLDNVLQTPPTSFENMTGKYFAEEATKRSVRIEIEEDESTGISFSKPSYDCKEIPESTFLDNGTQEVDEQINLSSVAKAKHGGSDLSEMVHERETYTIDPLEDSSVAMANHRDTEDSPETIHKTETYPKDQAGCGSVRNSKDLKVKSVSEMMKILEKGHLKAKIECNKLKLKVTNKKQKIEAADEAGHDSSKPCVLDTGVRAGYNLIDIQESSSPSKADFESKDKDREASGEVSSQEDIKSSELMTKHPNEADSKTVNNIGSFTVFKEPNTHNGGENMREFQNKSFGDKEEELSMELEMSAASGHIYFERDVTGISLEKDETMKERSVALSPLVKTIKDIDQLTSSFEVIGDILNQPLETDKEKPLCSSDTTDESLPKDTPTELEKLISEETTGEELVGDTPKELEKILIIPGEDIEVDSPKEVEKLLSPGKTTGSAIAGDALKESDKPLFIDTGAELNESLPRKSDNFITTGEILAEQAVNITKMDTSTKLKDSLPKQLDKSVDKAITTGTSVEQAHTKADKDASIELEMSTIKESSVELHQNIVDEDVLLAPTQCFAITLSQDSPMSTGLSPLILDKNNINRATSISFGNVLDGQEHYASEAQSLQKIQETDKIENALPSNDGGKSVDISKEEENRASTEESEKLNKNDSINYQSPVDSNDKSPSKDNIRCGHDRIDRDASPTDESETSDSLRFPIISIASKHKDVASQPDPPVERVESSQPFLNDTLMEKVEYVQPDPDPPENNIIITQPLPSKARISSSSSPVDKTGSAPANAADSVALNAAATDTNESLDLLMGDDFDISDSQLCAVDLCAPLLSWNPLAQDRNLYQQHIKKESKKKTEGHELVEDFIKDVSELNNMIIRTKNEIEAMRRRKHHRWST